MGYGSVSCALHELLLLESRLVPLCAGPLLAVFPHPIDDKGKRGSFEAEFSLRRPSRFSTERISNSALISDYVCSEFKPAPVYVGTHLGVRWEYINPFSQSVCEGRWTPQCFLAPGGVKGGSVKSVQTYLFPVVTLWSFAQIQNFWGSAPLLPAFLLGHLLAHLLPSTGQRSQI